jgi:hypothetical protein
MTLKRGDLVWLVLLAAFTSILVVPETRTAFLAATTAQPYLMGFAKFAVLATMGELLSLRLAAGKWTFPKGMLWKALGWGAIGMLVTLMFTFYSNGVAGAMKAGLLPGNPDAVSFGACLLKAFLISAIMNLTFGPVFMAAHRISDTVIDGRAAGRKTTVSTAVHEIDWQGFFRFVIAKTLPFFWIPAHTLAFLLPAEYRVVAAAYLSIALGMILVYARRRQGKTPALDATKEVAT